MFGRGDTKPLVHLHLLDFMSQFSAHQTALQPACTCIVYVYLFTGTMEELLRTVSGGLGGKGGKKQKRHLKKTRSKASSQLQTVTFGEGKY